MHQILRRQPWTCARCLRTQRRKQSTAAATASSLGNEHCVSNTRSHSDRHADDRLLRDAFNNRSFWREFSQNAKETAGLIGNEQLRSPNGFYTFAEKSLQKCKKIVEKTLAASTADEYRHIARDLDRLSDLLCRVIDISDFMRTIHPDPRFAAGATESFSLMFQYMNELNTTIGLNRQLKHALSMPEVTSQWSEEEKMVAQILMKDFAKSGIDLPEDKRQQFVQISNEISQAGTDFVNGMELAHDHVSILRDQLDGVDPTLVRNLSNRRRADVAVYGPVGRLVMSTAHDDTARRDIYAAERTSSRKSIERLERLLLRRAELARLTGYNSFAQMTLADKMSKTPEATINFLRSLHANNSGQVGKELDALLQVRKVREPSATTVNPWDHAYLLKRLRQMDVNKGYRIRTARLHEVLPNYFSLGNVMSGLSRLFSSLYGVRLVPRPAKIGEVWNPQVRRLDVLTEENDHIATIYCDLFARAGKPPNPAHFTLVCSREISEGEIIECQNEGEPINNGMPVGISLSSSTGALKRLQIPTIALVCDFSEAGNGPYEPTLLSLHNVTTLFHEMGHAIHSVLGRTSMQGISGTRCATDFAELPSVLMEYFATNPEVLKLFARHWQNDQPMPDDLIEALTLSQKEKASKSGGWDNETQILMALLDQSYHSQDVVKALENQRYNSTAVYHNVWDQFSSVKEPAGTAWQGLFGHLYGYGATYYAYLFDRAIARQVWKAVFRDGHNSGAVDRLAGERFKHEVLRWGGGRDPWTCLEGLMGEGKGILAEGGQEAMLEVGRWGVGAGAEGAM